MIWKLGEQLQVLQAAQGDLARLFSATVDIAFSALPDPERIALKDALVQLQRFRTGLTKKSSLC